MTYLQRCGLRSHIRVRCVPSPDIFFFTRHPDCVKPVPTVSSYRLSENRDTKIMSQLHHVKPALSSMLSVCQATQELRYFKTSNQILNELPDLVARVLFTSHTLHHMVNPLRDKKCPACTKAYITMGAAQKASD